jgi:hypothetical protein
MKSQGALASRNPVAEDSQKINGLRRPYVVLKQGYSLKVKFVKKKSSYLMMMVDDDNVDTLD